MELKFALIADHVTEDKGDKLIIVGEFNSIFSDQAPIQWQSLYLVARFEARISEGTKHQVRIGVYDEDGGQVVPLLPPLDIGFKPTGPGRPLRGQVIVRFENVHLPKFGDYEFHILIDGRLMATVPLYAVKVDTKRGGKAGR